MMVAANSSERSFPCQPVVKPILSLINLCTFDDITFYYPMDVDSTVDNILIYSILK